MTKQNINDIIRTLYPLIQADANHYSVEVELELGSVRELYLDNKEIKQLLINLVRNGIEAMAAGGVLRISTRLVEEEVILTIVDQGSGIPPHILKDLGKPFTTSKENGTGLGVAICYGIASRHRAKLEIETGPHGTTVRVIFLTVAK
jgi:signal transduction histidine kinase